MKFLVLLLLSVVYSLPLFAQEFIFKVTSPAEVKVEVTSANKGNVPPEFEGLQWNRWTSENFIVLSLDDEQAKYLNRHLEQIKNWILQRWGFLNVDFKNKCKLICVDDAEIFESLFKLKTTHVQVKKDNDGKIVESVIFLLVDDKPSNTIPLPLSEVVFIEFQNNYQDDFGLWFQEGAALLNGSLESIRSNILDIKEIIDNKNPIFFSQGVLTTTFDSYNKMELSKQKLFEQSSMCFLLFVRKEFGENKLHLFLKKYSDNGSLKALKEVLGFDSYEKFDLKYKTYLIDLTNDIMSDDTPDEYLQINSYSFSS